MSNEIETEEGLQNTSAENPKAENTKKIAAFLIGGLWGLLFAPLIFLVILYNGIKFLGWSVLGRSDLYGGGLLGVIFLWTLFFPFVVFFGGGLRAVRCLEAGDFWRCFDLFSKKNTCSPDDDGAPINSLSFLVLLNWYFFRFCGIKLRFSNRELQINRVLKAYSYAQIPMALGVLCAIALFVLVFLGVYSPFVPLLTLIPFMVGVPVLYTALASAGVVLVGFGLVALVVWGASPSSEIPGVVKTEEKLSVSGSSLAKPGGDLQPDWRGMVVNENAVDENTLDSETQKALSFIKQTMAAGKVTIQGLVYQGGFSSTDHQFFCGNNQCPNEIVELARGIGVIVANNSENGWQLTENQDTKEITLKIGDNEYTKASDLPEDNPVHACLFPKQDEPPALTLNT